jgi:hypothetical protein
MAKDLDAKPLGIKPTALEAKLRAEVKLRLMPMLCEARIGEQKELPGDGKSLVSKNAKGRIVIRATTKTKSAFRLFRSYPFDDSELTLARAFVEECVKVCEHHDKNYVDELAVAVPRKAIGQALGYREPELIAKILDQFDQLSNQTYERQRISAAVGLTNVDRDSGVTLTDVWSEDFAKVLTSGIESMLAVDPKGRVYAHLVPNTDANHVNSPQYLRFLSEWTTDAQICLVLNRNGEILVLKNKRLEFARRRGRWLHFAHDSILPLILEHCKVRGPKSTMTRHRTTAQTKGLPALVTRASQVLADKVHETCLDVSFARSGGCIAIIDADKRKAFEEKGLVSGGDLLGHSGGAKAKALHWLTTRGEVKSHARFTDLDRRFRQELAAIDGATVMDSEGFIIAIGAIVRVPPGSASGARRAAARALAEFGIGIKISADGEVSGFLADKKNDEDEIEEKCIFKYG